MEFFMIATDEDAFKVKPFVGKNKYIVPVFYSDGKVEADYKIEATPTTLVIDRQGIVQLQHRGFGAEEKYKKKIEELLRPEARGQ